MAMVSGPISVVTKFNVVGARNFIRAYNTSPPTFTNRSERAIRHFPSKAKYGS